MATVLRRRNVRADVDLTFLRLFPAGVHERHTIDILPRVGEGAVVRHIVVLCVHLLRFVVEFDCDLLRTVDAGLLMVEAFVVNARVGGRDRNVDFFCACSELFRLCLSVVDRGNCSSFGASSTQAVRKGVCFPNGCRLIVFCEGVNLARRVRSRVRDGKLLLVDNRTRCRGVVQIYDGVLAFVIRATKIREGTTSDLVRTWQATMTNCFAFKMGRLRLRVSGKGVDSREDLITVGVVSNCAISFQ